MAKRDPETDPKGFLGDELKRVRLAAGFSSQDAMAARLGFDRTVITKAETGDRPPTDDVLAAWCAACGLPAELVELFARLVVLARRADGPVPTWFEDWLKAESEAHTLRVWQPLIVPGLLQTAEYARALTHLVGAAERPAISVEIVPSSTGANAGLSGGFQLASCDGTPDVLNMNGVRDVTEERGAIVRHATRIFDRARGDALPRTASRALIMEAAEQWKTI